MSAPVHLPMPRAFHRCRHTGQSDPPVLRWRRSQEVAMELEHLIVKDEGPVTEIVLNRPERRNALSVDLMTELTAALEAVSGRVVVISGAGPCFSAGHDLSEMVGRPVTFYRELFDACTVL